MPNSAIFHSVSTAWASEQATGKRVLDLSCGEGQTAEMLEQLGFQVVATDYSPPRPMSHGVERVGGVDLNCFLPFRKESFDGLDLVEVIEHIENQPQLIREMSRVLKPGGVALISTPKDPVQRRYNWKILSYLFNPALLLSDNIVVKIRKRSSHEGRASS